MRRNLAMFFGERKNESSTLFLDENPTRRQKFTFVTLINTQGEGYGVGFGVSVDSQ